MMARLALPRGPGSRMVQHQCHQSLLLPWEPCWGGAAWTPGRMARVPTLSRLIPPPHLLHTNHPPSPPLPPFSSLQWGGVPQPIYHSEVAKHSQAHQAQTKDRLLSGRGGLGGQEAVQSRSMGRLGDSCAATAPTQQGCHWDTDVAPDVAERRTVLISSALFLISGLFIDTAVSVLLHSPLPPSSLLHYSRDAWAVVTGLHGTSH